MGIFVLDPEVKQTTLTGLIRAGLKIEDVSNADEDKKIFKISWASQKAIG